MDFRGSGLDFANAVVYNKASNLKFISEGAVHGSAICYLKQQAYNVIKENHQLQFAQHRSTTSTCAVNTSRTPVRTVRWGVVWNGGLIKIMPKRGIVVSP